MTDAADVSELVMGIDRAPALLPGERRERVLLRPWLENLIHSGLIPGLEWIDAGKTMFKVPWKHRSKKNWSLRHSSVFLVTDISLLIILIILISLLSDLCSAIRDAGGGSDQCPVKA